jgi:hypothetical protein
VTTSPGGVGGSTCQAAFTASPSRWATAAGPGTSTARAGAEPPRRARHRSTATTAASTTSSSVSTAATGRERDHLHVQLHAFQALSHGAGAREINAGAPLSIGNR